MANADTRFGLRPVKYNDGRPWTGKVRKYYVPASDGTALYIGDVLDLAGSSDGDGIASVTRATLADGNYTIGPIVAFEPITNDSLPYRAASTDRYLFVADDPDLLFEIQADSAGTIAATEIGLNAIGILTHGGSTITGLSGMELDTTGTAPSADSSNMFLIMEGIKREDNVFSDAHGKLLVMISKHRYTSTTHGKLGVA